MAHISLVPFVEWFRRLSLQYTGIIYLNIIFTKCSVCGAIPWLGHLQLFVVCNSRIFWYTAWSNVWFDTLLIKIVSKKEKKNKSSKCAKSNLAVSISSIFILSYCQPKWSFVWIVFFSDRPGPELDCD